MPSKDADSKLTATEAALRSLIPRPAHIDRDRLMYEAGRMSSRRRGWPMATGFFAALSAVLAVRLAHVPEPARPEIVATAPASSVPESLQEVNSDAKRSQMQPGFVELLLGGVPDVLPADRSRQRQIEEWLRGDPAEVPLAAPSGTPTQPWFNDPADFILLRRGRL